MGDVRGPTSALTAFLREKNIHIPNRFQRRRQQQQDQDTSAAQGDLDPAAQGDDAQASTSGDAAAAAGASPTPAIASPSRELVLTPDEPAEAGPSRTRARASRRSTTTSAVPQKRKKPAPAGASMNFDEEDDDDDWQASDDDEAGISAVKGEDDDDDYVDSGSTHAAAADDKWTRIRNGEVVDVSHKAVTSGTIDFCPGCSGRFTITQYTVQTESGGLCHKCGPQYNKAIAGGGSTRRGSGGTTTKSKGAGASGSKTSAPARKKRTIVKRPQDKRVLSTLQHMCINIISEHIEDVEALGGIGDRNIEILSKSICRNRRLNDQTFQLFLEPHTETLKLYDCSRLTSDALATVGVFSPRIHTINLQQCGQLDNVAFDAWTDKLTSLRSLELYGPYLVRKESWLRFLDKVGNRLVSLKLRETPRFDLSCVEKLVAKCPDLKELGLAQIGPLNGDCLKPIAKLKSLTYLDVSDPGVSIGGIPPEGLKDDEVIELLSHVGHDLQHLDLSGNTDLTSRVVTDGILPYCSSLRTLRLGKLDKVESSALADLFESFAARDLPKLHVVDLTRCTEVADDCLEALIKHSGPHLLTLSINSCGKITAAGGGGGGTDGGDAATGDSGGSGGGGAEGDGDGDTKMAITATTLPGEGGLNAIAKHCASLRTLDVSFVRSCAEAEVLSLIEGCKSLELLKVFGCNRIPDYVVGTAKCAIVGLEKVPIVTQPRTTGG